VYEYDGKQKPVGIKKISIKYKEGDKLISKTFNTLFTHHGPVMAKRDGAYLTLRHNNRDMQGFIQSWLRTKATTFLAFKKTMDMHANPSNNTVYADGEGNIAYWHGNFLPKRDPKYDWSRPVDGSTSATEWKGMHTVNESVHVYNPENGWLQNCNSSPFAVAGKYSPKRSDYVPYLAPDGENFRGVNAVRVLDEEKKYNLDKVIKAGYDTRLTAYELLVPALIKAFEKNAASNDTLNAQLKAPMAVLQQWDYRSGEQSVATTLAVEWGQRILPVINKMVVPQTEFNDIVARATSFAKNASPDQLLEPLIATVKDLEARYGTWQMPWGDINRFQRISGDIINKFDDNQPSLPVGFVSSTWGMLPSFNSRIFQGTKKRYGYNGNSFIAAVEFGKKIKAKSLLAGGESGHEDSPHFFDQGEPYTKGRFKDVLFYKEDVMKHAEKSYHPGEEK
jgi:acyl-homoserine lactone acylase PvdQ